MNFIKALAIFLGTIIGVGIFGLPFVAYKAGFFIVTFYFILMVSIVIWVNLIYAEVVLAEKKVRRFPGYVGEYLGKKWKNTSFIVMAVGLIGALLAYLIIGGEFLSSFLNPYLGGTPLLYTFLFFIPGAYLIFKGTKSISGVEIFLLFALLIILGVFFIKAFPYVDFNQFDDIHLDFLFFPHGVVLFSLWGTALIPEMKEIVNGSRSVLRKVIISGIIISSLIYLLFIFIVLGASKPVVSEEAISGLNQVIRDDVVKLGFIFGVIACFTSFIALGLTLKKILWHDFGLSKNLSWALTCFLPLFLFLSGLREFIKVISLTGSVALGIEGIIIILLYRKFLKKKLFRPLNPVFYFLIGIFILGIALELFYFLW
ncbi:MAG: aromatic amino acid transport family protein [bacterium]|nr:aromatic amino acid transport family protein [bacterium]